ncbi:MAG: hypothetical protein M1834_009382 [Cirrosporium novae-zelandiae]|nr:MAG: hypothetical protein M1834_009382 [Cirrosporium novae-zelandiae]
MADDHPMSPEEYEALQKASDDYRPDPTGPLIGEKKSTNFIKEEYAKADPVYQEKTAHLPQTYSHFRTTRGDGNCGWRSVGFCYFETLAELGDHAKVMAEYSRLKSMNNLISVVGYDLSLYADFAEQTFDLLKELAQVILDKQDPVPMLVERFNTFEVSNAIIVHLRVMTGAWLQTHIEQYQPFLLDQTISQYCKSTIDPFHPEIDNLGMQALIDAVIQPAGIAVEIQYLDRSAGHEVNVLKFQAQNPDGTPIDPNAPTFRLLYRPGHYDILYKIALPPTTVAYATDVSAMDIRDIPSMSWNDPSQGYGMSGPDGRYPSYDFTCFYGFSFANPDERSSSYSSPYASMPQSFAPPPPSPYPPVLQPQMSPVSSPMQQSPLESTQASSMLAAVAGSPIRLNSQMLVTPPSPPKMPEEPVTRPMRE